MPSDLPHALFRGGYLLTEAGRTPALPDDRLRDVVAAWRRASIGRYAIRYDETWPLAAHARAGEAEVLLLGTALDIDRPAAGAPEVVRGLAQALDDSDAAFLDRLDAVTGAHVVVARREDRYRVLQDATGMEALCYDTGGPGPLVASHPALIAEIRGYEPNELSRLWIYGSREPLARRLKMWAGANHYPGITTAYDEVKALTPNTRLDLGTGRVERFFPREPVGVREMDEVVEVVADHLRDAAAWVAARYPGAAQVSLSGGLDSRLTLAATRDVAHELAYFTYHWPKHPVLRHDVEVAEALAERLGIEHRTWELVAGRDLRIHAADWRRTWGGLHGNGRIEFSWLRQYPAGQLHVRSNVLETLRGYYLRRSPRNRRDRFDARRLARFFRPTHVDEFLPYHEEFVEVTGFTPGAKLDLHYTDLYHWEQRLGRWHSDLVRRSKLSHNTFVIWNSRRIMTAMLARPAEDRWKARVVWNLIERLWPEALEVPVFSGSRYVERPGDRPQGRIGELRDWGHYATSHAATAVSRLRSA